MSWDAVARKDYADAVRSKWVWGVAVFLTLIVTLVAYFVGADSSNQVLNPLLSFVVTPLIPLVSLIVAYSAIVGERESGSLKLLLSLPNSRADVVVGKLVGRTAAVATPIVLGLLVPFLAFLIAPTRLDAPAYVGFVALTVVLATAYVSIAVGASAAVSSRIRAMALAVVLYFIFVPLWNAVQLPLRFYLLFSGGNFPVDPQLVYQLLGTLNPGGAYKQLTNAVLAGDFSGQWLPLSAAVLLAWIIVPPALGLLAFERADL
ncbi:ABC transporter permease subunit [Halocalculus aciditolerans]|uniref:Copper ABC transporter permease n=1 Tax=Halocalculus aciditolerans TaxID=1383812 RepID=A0A830FEG9_9EURY|nr:ABC transporter permease subunit [Halocalculus aciditolerans]GGL46955.1 copper ABC transporter permease [Halocalculus aciditolerans]